MTVIYRKPQRLVVVRGTPLARVLTCRVTEGFDQALATADVVIPYPPPATVGHRSAIRVYLGETTPILRFTGFVTAIRNTNWPTRILLSCEDALSRTVRWKPETAVDLSNMTPKAAIQAILTIVGVPFVAANIDGTDKVAGTSTDNPALLWQPNETALSKIQQFDQIDVYTTAEGLKSVYRTFADRSGTLWRLPMNPLPSATAALTFVEGDDDHARDIEQNSASIEAAEPSDTATAAGFGGLSVTVTGTAPWAVISNPQSELYPMLETITPSADQLDLASQALYLQERKAANLLRGDFTTRRDDVIGPFATIHYDSTRTMAKLNALVQSKTIEQNERGGLTQQVSWISYRELNVFTDTDADGNPIDPYPEFDPSDGSEIPSSDLPTFPDLPPEGDADIIASFVVTMIDVESVLIDGAYVTLYTAAVESTSTSSTGTITALAWTAGGGGTPASGSGTTFNPSWTDLASATVSLHATDSNGNSATAPALPITLTMGAPVMRRELYTAEGDAGDFDGTTWRTDANSNGTVGVVANGPLWAAGDTAQFGKLTAAVTDAPESEILSSYDIKSAWVERDVSTTNVAAGLTVGRVARSSDAGDNWTETTRLAEHTEDVLQVILSRDNQNQIWALQASAIWISTDGGASWGLVRAAAGGQSFIALRLAPSRNLVSSTGGPSPLERAEAPGTPFTFTGTDPTEITGIAFNTYADEVCAITGDTPPKVWVTDGIGSFNMVPAGVPDLSAFSGSAPYPRNLQQDGSIARQVYAAVGDYALKSTDFFKADTVHVLRHVGEGGCGAGPIVMIGQGDLVGGTTPTGGGSDGPPACGTGDAKFWAAYEGTLWAYRTDNTWDERGSVTDGTLHGSVFDGSKMGSDSTLRVFGGSGTNAFDVRDGCSQVFESSNCPEPGQYAHSHDFDRHYVCGPVSGSAADQIWLYRKDLATWTAIHSPGVGFICNPMTSSATKIWWVERVTLSFVSGMYHLFNANLDGSGAVDCGSFPGTVPIQQIFGSYLGDVCMTVLPNGQVWRSTGSTVGNISTIPHAGGINTAAWMSSYDGALWIAAHSVSGSGAGYISTSSDTGGTWTVRHTGGEVNDAVTAYATAEYCPSSGEWFAEELSDGSRFPGFLVSSDNGVNWTHFDGPVGHTDFPPNRYATVKPARA